MEDHRLVLSEFQDILKNERKTLFQNDFQYHMTQESCDTLQNMQKLIAGYEELFHKPPVAGSKVLLLFGLLQGLFVAIDCLYTIGRSTSLNKMMININQNIVLREIKHIRNDIVGHPSYRYYEDNVVGFCALDIENLIEDELVYDSVVYVDHTIKTTKHRVKMLEVIKQYYQESNEVLSQTLQFFKMKQSKSTLNLSFEVNHLAELFMSGTKDHAMLDTIEEHFKAGLHLKKDSNHRVIW
jgi:hypothetical protein